MGFDNVFILFCVNILGMFADSDDNSYHRSLSSTESNSEHIQRSTECFHQPNVTGRLLEFRVSVFFETIPKTFLNVTRSGIETSTTQSTLKLHPQTAYLSLNDGCLVIESGISTTIDSRTCSLKLDGSNVKFNGCRLKFICRRCKLKQPEPGSENERGTQTIFYFRSKPGDFNNEFVVSADKNGDIPAIMNGEILYALGTPNFYTR